VLVEAGTRIPEDACVGPVAYLGEGVVLGPRCRVEHAVVLSGGHVAAGETLQNAIAWEGGRIAA
jgi:UDP-3-O-[3-hydroxymyristoyl] glucosamine N-acyltransferase